MKQRSQKTPPVPSALPSLLTENALLTDGVFFVKKLSQWYDVVARPLPWRTLWLRYQNPWHIWISEIMLQQTVIKAVIPVYEKFFDQFPDHVSLSQASTEDIRLAVRGLGYYRRFDLLHRACKQLTAANLGLPQNYEDWLKLPGIGTYTAAAIASITLDIPQGVVDGNVERVLCRLLDIRSEPNLPHLKKRFQTIMNHWCSLGRPGTINQSVMELGQTICTPSSPKCDACPIRSRCASLAANSQHLAPAPKSKTEFTRETLHLQIIQSKNLIALIRRPSDAKFLKNTWGFFTEYKTDRIQNKIGEIKHSITTHKITANISVTSSLKMAASSSDIRWLEKDAVEKNLVSNLDRKAWKLYLSH